MGIENVPLGTPSGTAKGGVAALFLRQERVSWMQSYWLVVYPPEQNRIS